MSDEPTTPQTDEPADAPLGEGGVKALQTERQARKQAEAELQQLRDQLSKRDRADVAREFNLPDTIAERLTGDSLDELRADGQRLAADLRTAVEREPVVPASDHQGRGWDAPRFSADHVADRIVGGHDL